MSGDTYPIANGLADKVCRALMAERQCAHLSVIEICERFDVRSNEVGPLLLGAVQHAWLVRSRVMLGQGAMWVYKAGPALIAMAEGAAKTGQAPAPAPAAPPAAAPAIVAAVAKPPRKTSRLGKRLPPLDVASIQVSYDVPVPTRGYRSKGESQYTPLFRRLDKVGASAPAPLAYKAALTKAAGAYAKHHAPAAKFSVRPDEDDATLCRVHRTA